MIPISEVVKGGYIITINDKDRFEDLYEELYYYGIEWLSGDSVLTPIIDCIDRLLLDRLIIHTDKTLQYNARYNQREYQEILLSDIDFNTPEATEVALELPLELE